jgi:hypothetical protein
MERRMIWREAQIITGSKRRSIGLNMEVLMGLVWFAQTPKHDDKSSTCGNKVQTNGHSSIIRVVHQGVKSGYHKWERRPIQDQLLLEPSAMTIRYA